MSQGTRARVVVTGLGVVAPGAEDVRGLAKRLGSGEPALERPPRAPG